MIKGGEDFFKDKSDDFSSGAKRSSFRNFGSDNIPAIEKIFQEVLGRKPSSREASYYKYSTISEEELRTKLLSSDEHIKILEDASKLSNIEDELRNSQLNEKRLTQRVQDFDSQIAETNILLSEKNRIIEELREKEKNPYNFADHSRRYEEGFDIYSTPKVAEEKINSRKTFKDLLKEFLDLLIK
jgi:hypothetical protein